MMCTSVYGSIYIQFVIRDYGNPQLRSQIAWILDTRFELRLELESAS